MTCIHSYFTQPRFTVEDTRRFWAFELLTWAMSIMTWRKNMEGDVLFYGDAGGVGIVKKLGLDRYYKRVVELRNPFDLIHSKTFWAAGKLIAMRECEAFPVVSVDLDLMVWKRLKFPRADVVGLNYDNPEFYEVVCEKYKDDFFGFNLSSPAMNAGILAFFDRELLDIYTDSSLYFMRRFSGRAGLDTASMIFAEQKLAGIVADRLGKKQDVLFNVGAWSRYRVMDEGVTHLWDVKKLYAGNKQMRDAYITWLGTRMECIADEWFREWWYEMRMKGDVIYI